MILYVYIYKYVCVLYTCMLIWNVYIYSYDINIESNKQAKNIKIRLGEKGAGIGGDYLVYLYKNYYVVYHYVQGIHLNEIKI